MLVFVHYWEQSQTLPQVSQSLGLEATRKIYKQLAENHWRGLSDPRIERWLLCNPPEACDSIASWLPGADQVLPLPPLDRGQRLAWGFEQAFQRATPFAVAVRMECPPIKARTFHEIGRALEGSDVALVPTSKGSYAMIGLKRSIPELFKGVPWGTSEVLSATIDIAMDLGLSVYQLPTQREVVTLEDLIALGWELPGRAD